jgi:hypothetical protein
MKKLILFLILALAAQAQTGSINGVPNQVITGAQGPFATKTFNLAQNAGTYTLFTATTGAVGAGYCTFQVSVTATGLTSLVLQSSDATPIIVLGKTLTANLVAGTNLNSFVGPLYMASSGTINAIIAGNGTAGSLIATCWYSAIGTGATLQ